MKRVGELANAKSDSVGLAFLDRHGDEITVDAEYDKVDIDEVHGVNVDYNGNTGVEQLIKLLPVPDNNNPPGIILAYN